MTSVLASPQQVPSHVGYFKVSSASGSTLFYPEPFIGQFTVGTNGVTAISGNEITFSTYALAVTNLTNGSAPYPVGAALSNGQFYRDMGKSWHIIVGGYRVASLEKVQRYGTDGQTTEGVIGSSLSTTPALSGKQYTTGYVVVWTANPTSIPMAVTRTGYF